MKKTFYEKVGKTYKPVAEYDSDWIDSFPKGNHLVCVYPGGTSRKFNIDPATAPLIAAGTVSKDAMIEALRTASEMRPQRTPITPGQQRAWKKLAKEFGDDICALQYNSLHDVADAGVKALIAEAEKKLANPAVRAAYEQFLMVYKLSE
jgi:hypothetical protein